jgi:hypothetical protein
MRSHSSELPDKSGSQEQALNMVIIFYLIHNNTPKWYLSTRNENIAFQYLCAKYEWESE